MTNLYLVRHGETEWNKCNRVQGRIDTELSENGINQAMLLGKRLSEENIDFVYSSNQKRAKRTAEIIADFKKHIITEVAELQEIGLGPWEGLTVKEIQEQYSDCFKVYVEEPENFYLPGAETIAEVAERTYKAFLDIAKKNPGKNIVIVSHGTAIKAAIIKILGIDLKNYTKFKIDNASISIISYKEEYNGSVTIKLLNDTNHLKLPEEYLGNLEVGDEAAASRQYEVTSAEAI